MAVVLNEDLLREMLHAAVSAPDGAQKRALSDRLLMHLIDTETVEVWGRSIAKHFGRPSDHEEIIQVVTEGLLVYIRGIEAGDVENISRIATNLYYHAKSSVARWIDSPAVTVAQEMSGFSRRYRMAIVARQEYVTEHRREPSNRELVDYMNAKAHRNRKDPAKQGALVTEADVVGLMLKPYSMDYRPPDGDGDPGVSAYGTPDDGGIEDRGDLALTVRMLGDLADELYGKTEQPTAREVLAVWMNLVEEGQPPTVTEVGARLGMHRKKARERVRQIEELLATFRERSAGPAAEA